MNVHAGFAPVNGTELYYEESGTGFPLVLAHRGIADHRMWDEQFPVFAEHYRAIRYDLRGFGQSRLVPGSFTHYEDLDSMLRCLGIERAFLVGSVLGATIIIDFAIFRPDVPAAVVTVGTSLSDYRYQGCPRPTGGRAG